MINNKKDDHVNLARKFHRLDGESDFDKIRFVHHSFPETSVDDVEIHTKIENLELSAPFFINAMTGGSNMTKDVNKMLAEVSKGANIPIASGSLSWGLKDKELLESFKIIRNINKEGLVFANLGAEHGLEDAKRAIDILNADALQIHINVPQELAMPEGDRDFRGYLKNIEDIAANINIPLIVKEVGFGMSRDTVELLKSIGVKNIDISGSGGTNFAKIENFRRDINKLNFLESIGQSTVISLLEAYDLENVSIISSGGVRGSMDIVKSLSLGTKAVGLSARILTMTLDMGVDKTVEKLNNWKDEIKYIMALLGKTNIEELKTTDIIVASDIKDWCELRNIDCKKLANRKIKY